LAHRAEYKGDQLAFTFLVDGENQEERITFSGLDQRARAIAAWLEQLDLRGERVLLLYPAGLDFIAAFFGCMYAGVVAVTAYPPRPNRSLERIEAIAQDAGARVALTLQGVRDRVQPLMDRTPLLQNLRWLCTDLVPDGIEDQWRRPPVTGDTLAFLQYTSGSTGTPKGVMLTHSNLLHNAALIDEAFEHTRTSKGVYWLPSYHDMGLVGGIVEPVFCSMHNVMMSPMAFLQRPVRWLQAITKHRGTTSGGPNFAYDLCLQKVTPEERDQLDLSSWRVAFNGAEPIHSDTIDRFCEYFGPCGFRREAFYPCYGLAEATLIVSGGRQSASPILRTFDSQELESRRVVPVSADDPAARTLVGCGENLPDQKIAVVHPETRIGCGAREIGEIWVSGPSIAKGYWRRPEESLKTFGAQLEGDDTARYLRTGDLGFLDEDGELFVAGRIKDLIIVRGVNHYPQDIERTVEQSHPGIRANCGAAFSVEMEGRQQLVITQEIGRSQMREPESVFDAIRRDVSRVHELQPDVILLVKPGGVPKTSSGKIQRHACRNAFLAGELHLVAVWRREEADSMGSAEFKRNTTVPPKSRAKAVPAPSEVGNGITSNGVMGHGIASRGIASHGSVESGAGVDAPGETMSSEKLSNSQARQKPQNAAEIVLGLVRQAAEAPLVPLTLDASLSDLGLDSLARIELQSKIEDTFGGRIPEQVATQIETVREIVDAVEAHLGRPLSGPVQTANIPPEAYRFEMFPEYQALRETIEAGESTGVKNPYFVAHDGICSNVTTIGGREYINFCSYNYLGMSGDPVVAQAAKKAVDRYGTSVSASRLVSGERPIHRELERAIAAFIGVEASLVFVGGHATNETTIGHLCGPKDLVLHDALAHNSIVQGAVLSGARRRPFPHNDWQALDRILNDLRGDYRRVLVAIEGVYSMDGDIPDLPRFIEVKKKHKGLLMVDEAHSAGTLGAHGRGVAEHFGVDPEDVDIWMGTLSKTYGSCGGYIAGNHALVEYLKYTAPGFLFSVGIPPSNAAAALASLRLLEAEPERVHQVQARARLFWTLAKQRGLNTGLSHDSPVVPIVLGNSLDCLRLSRGLFERGVNVQPIMYPAVEESAARLRFFITCLHTEEQIREAVDVLAEEVDKIDPAYRGAIGTAVVTPRALGQSENGVEVRISRHGQAAH
jgi:8-amino-7-oxononanoate synthase/acyl carrier protein